MKTILNLLRTLVVTSFAISTFAQEVSIPDAGLNAAVREALRKPVGPLTGEDLLSLTNLTASNRNITSVEGIEGARNLISLELQRNHLATFSAPTTLTELKYLDLSLNSLTNCVVPNDLTNLVALIVEGNGLTHFDLPAGLSRLHWLNLDNNQITSINLPSDLTDLTVLDLGFNLLTNFSLPGELTNLAVFTITANQLADFTLPAGLTALTEVNLSENGLRSVSLPDGMTNLFRLNLFFNQLTNLTVPSGLSKLNDLNLDFNRLTDLHLPSDLSSINLLHLRSNQLTEFNLPEQLRSLLYLDVSLNPLARITLPPTLNNLNILRLSENRLTSLTLPVGMTNLAGVNLSQNQLTNVVLPPDLNRLESINLGGNQLTSVSLPAGLTNLSGLFFTGNQLTSITLPPDLTRLKNFGFLGNPLQTFVLSEELAAAGLADEVIDIQNQGAAVFTYPLAIELVRLLPLAGGVFKFAITGPPGIYTVLGSTNLTVWSMVSSVTNPLGSINFHDVTASSSPQKFYRALLQSPPTNMVFIAPNTFTMGSQTNELHRDINEGPQTTVTLTRGFWIGKYEVTQGEYLSVTSTNPSQFPGDLSRPISSVSWPDATNYCWMLTQRELAAGRIPAGSQYRLPTEAEWECAARAGTTTRFSYGDDLGYDNLASYAWQSLDDGLTVHPVGWKLPNPWGLYDMAGNVFEWCQDWLGPLPGGFVTDPLGPPSNPIGEKIMRGGAFDVGGPACRSASRMFSGNHPALTDWNLGFRVVLVTEPSAGSEQ